MMLSTKEVKVLEDYLAEESDSEVEGELLQHYAEVEETLRADAAWRLNHRFDFESCTPLRFKQLFRFEKDDIVELKDALGLPDKMTGENRSTWTGLEGLLVVLRFLAYPTRGKDVEKLFGRGNCSLSVIFNTTLSFIYDRWSHLLSDLGRNLWLTRARVEEACAAVHAKAPVHNVWGFIDGTVRRIARPITSQRLFYSGHKRCHCIKFQAVTTAHGMFAHLYGPIEGRRHDSFMLAESKLTEQLEEHMADGDDVYAIYGDAGYPLRNQLMGPFQGAALTADQQQFNTMLSQVRVSVEWMFGVVTTLFSYLDFRRNLKMLLQPVAKYYAVGVILTNCHCCLYGNQVSKFFEIQPPSLSEYLSL